MAMGAASSPSAAAGQGMVATHVVQVGGPNGSLTFSPENIKANVGDLVQFQFHPKNHSVVQSTFDEPCVPMQNVMPNATNAFFSGFMPTNASASATSGILTYTIRVMDTKPVWYYCSQAKHCQAGMVGAINAATSGNKTMSAFKALAAQASANLSPGQGSSGAGSASPSGGAGSGSGSGGSATSAAGGAGGEATATSSASGSPAEQTTNAAPGLDVSSSQSLFGLTVGVFAAFFML
jgi:plastocyanin